MQISQHIAYLHGPFHDVFFFLSSFLIQFFGQCFPFYIIHQDEIRIIFLNNVNDGRQVRMPKFPQDTRFGYQVLADHICENTNNSTRFIIVSRKPVYRKDADQVSICFELPHESGSLYNILSHIIYNGLNMTKIESRPVPGKAWEYRFFVDFEGNLNDSSVSNALTGLEAEALKLRILGNY